MSAGRVALVAVAVVAIGAVGVEVVGRSVTERVATTELEAAGVDVSRVSVGRSWWRPSVLPALLTGDLDRVDIELRDTRVSGVEVAEADYELRDLSVDLDPFARTVRVTDLGSGSFRLLIAPEAITPLIGAAVSARNGELRVGPDQEPARLRVDGTELVIDSSYLRRQGLVDRVVVVDTGLLPCDPDAEVVGEFVELSCTGDRLPGVLATPLGRGSGGGPLPPAELPPPARLDREDEGG